VKKFTFIQRLTLLFVPIVVFMALGASVLYAQLKYTGVNLAGAEFGVSNGNLNLPGNFGTDYTYPTPVEVDYYMDKGMNTFRLPFRWERLQHSQFSAFDIAELGYMDAFINYANAQGAYVIIDPHNFHRYYPASNDYQSSEQGLIGSDVSNDAFADFWSKIANHYKGNSKVIFSLMNEPNTMPTEQLVNSSNIAIQAIRNTGATNLILVSGNEWSGAWSWDETWYGGANSEYMLNIVDSGNNFAFEVHQYMDDNCSGGSSQITNNDPMIGVKRLTSFTNWLKQHNLKGFLGEFAVANSRIGHGIDDVGDEVINNMLDYIEENSVVWIGWTWWAGGPWWGEYMFTLESTNLGQPDQGPDRPAMGVLQGFLYPENLYIQNEIITGTKIYNARDTIEAGNNVTTQEPEGDVVIESGANINFEAGSIIRIKPGFRAKAGSILVVTVN
jgi:endoglucanase